MSATFPPCGCVAPSASTARRHELSPAGRAAQKNAYDAGVAYYGEEKFEQARTSWREAARLAPDTPLGREAQENLKKVERILKSLQELSRQ